MKHRRGGILARKKVISPPVKNPNISPSLGGDIIGRSVRSVSSSKVSPDIRLRTPAGGGPPVKNPGLRIKRPAGGGPPVRNPSLTRLAGGGPPIRNVSSKIRSPGISTRPGTKTRTGISSRKKHAVKPSVKRSSGITSRKKKRRIRRTSIWT